MIQIKSKLVNVKTLRIQMDQVEVFNLKNQSLQKRKQKNNNDQNVKIVVEALKKVKLASKTSQNQIVIVLVVQ
jgi:Tfp pilus assembly PilM family ATPase